MPVTFIDIPSAPWPVLQEGVHTLTITEFETLFVFNSHRRNQYEGLRKAIDMLKEAGCSKLYIDGSYVTKKPLPGDYDACWEREGVDITKLDKVLLDFSDRRRAQKEKYEGEFFLADNKADHVGTLFLDFFQREKHSGCRKGIVLLELHGVVVREESL
ncbi:hypothetical protein DRB05_20490 [Pseudoalteromonas sp. A757]|nr:hypothetical protein DRB05_20490 [Pseudoalteromonas sp. A757]